jgi:hypothetical protein
MQRKVSKEGRAACARAGAANLKKWRASKDADATRVLEMTVAFETQLREEIGQDTAIASALSKSAVASYSTICIASLNLLKGLGRLDRVKELHGLLCEAQRLLYRNLKALLAWKESPEARDAALKRLTASVPPLTEEDRKAAADATAARIKSEVEAAKKKFAWLESGDPNARPDEE